MFTIIGILSDIVGVVILFWNGNFSRNFGRIKEIALDTPDQDGRGGGFKVTSKQQKFSNALDGLGILLVVGGFVLQLIGALIEQGYL